MEVARQILAVTLVFGLLGAAVWALRRGPAAARAGMGSGWGAGWLRRAGESKIGTRLGSNFGAERTVPSPAIERIGRLALTPQHSLHLVRVQGQDVVVATHPQGCSVVSGAPSATLPASGRASA